MPDRTWGQLIMERRTAPPALDGERFRQWMAGRRIFVSSTMDAEMTPVRVAVATYLRGQGASPVLWEGITPQDRRADDAFIDGVDSSSLFLLLLGSRYGQSDSSGYSPTHKEANRARELGIPRLLFERAMPSADRAGPLNDWLGSLYSELSAARYMTAEDLVTQLDQRLREIAGGQDSHWVKLGNLVFPATVRQRSEHGATTFHVRTTLRDPAVRHAVMDLGQSASGGFRGGGRALQLTWGLATHAVRVDGIDVHSAAVSADEVEIICTAAGQLPAEAYASFGGITFSGPSGTIGPVEQAAMWANVGLFGGTLPDAARRDAFLVDMVTPAQPLPQVLNTTGARGWLAEGLTRIYAIEGLAAKFGGRFESLQVGPATAMGVRVRGRYLISSFSPRIVEINGSVPLSL